MSTQPKPYITPEEYLAIERKAEFKSEYFNGEMFAMAGAGERHNYLAGALIGFLFMALRNRCRVYPSDMRVRVSQTGLYTYPDIVVVCGDPQLIDGELDTLLNPSVIIEVLSPSTESYDRGKKFDHYRTVDSLKQYVLVSTDRIHIDIFTRGENVWTFSAADGPDADLQLESVGFSARLGEIYGGVELT